MFHGLTQRFEIYGRDAAQERWSTTSTVVDGRRNMLDLSKADTTPPDTSIDSGPAGTDNKPDARFTFSLRNAPPDRVALSSESGLGSPATS